MSPLRTLPVTAFEAGRRLAAGPLGEVALVVKAAGACALIFDDASGRIVELDLRGSDAEVLARLRAEEAEASPDEPSGPRGRGRPKLGVVAREVTLLPRHWDWLARQPGGASVALRRLVEQARRDNAGEDAARDAREAAYRVMSALAGDLPGFEAASRALFATDPAGFREAVSAWPADLAAYVSGIAFRRAG
jgi:uncharacterized protein